MNLKAQLYFENLNNWETELILLRKIILDCQLTEDFKWKNPCYTFQNNNVVLIHGFKDYCALLFFNGALLHDTHNLLVQQTQNVQAARQIRFTNYNEIISNQTVLKNYIYQSIEVAKSGLKVNYKKISTTDYPEELLEFFDKNSKFKNAFEQLTEGRKKGYILHFSQAKQKQTRLSRIEKCIPRILIGKGLTDCTCGLSKRMPNCDGSHNKR